MKWNFLYQITAASRTPDYGATAPRSLFSLSSTEFVEPPPNKIPGCATGNRSVSCNWTRNGGTVALINDVGLVMWHTDHLTSYGSDRDGRPAPCGRCGETANCLHSGAPAVQRPLAGAKKTVTGAAGTAGRKAACFLCPRWTRLLFIHGRHYFEYTGLFISPSGTSELDCATTKTDTAERSLSIGRESLKVFFVLGALAYLQVPPLGGSRD